MKSTSGSAFAVRRSQRTPVASWSASRASALTTGSVVAGAFARSGAKRSSSDIPRSVTIAHSVATDGRASTDTLALHVTDRPFVGDVALRAQYPAYLGRPAESREVATFVVFLASDESSYATGSEFIVDGGLVTDVPHKDFSAG